MTAVGTPVAHGAMSTLLGLLCLAGSASYLFQTFCVLGVLVVCSGAFNALVVLPALLYLTTEASSVTCATASGAARRPGPRPRPRGDGGRTDTLSRSSSEESVGSAGSGVALVVVSDRGNRRRGDDEIGTESDGL